MRLFISLELPTEVKDALILIQNNLKNEGFQKNTDSRFVSPQNLHITLAFLGSVAPEHMCNIIERLHTISFEPFTLTLGKLEINSIKKPHVLWMTIHSKELYDLANSIMTQLPEYSQEREFKAHCTFVRIKKVYDKEALKMSIETINRTIEQKTPLTWTAKSFTLQQSLTLPEGAHYETLKVFPLKN